MPLLAGTRLLRGRYELIGPPVSDSPEAISWKGISEEGIRYFIKTWSYEGIEPDRVQQALWDAELRTLYRVGSTPGASDTLVVLRDAGLDRDARCFVMVLEAPGYEPVMTAITQKSNNSWLTSRDGRSRRDIWIALGRVAAGLSLLHDQQVLHRDVGANALLFSSDEGPESIRLGGFEWSVRLGRPLDAHPPIGWASPPERIEGPGSAWRPDDDWFGFGLLCARLLLDVENYASNDPVTRHARVLRGISGATRGLTELERSLIQRLIAFEAMERIVRPYDILAGIQQITRLLAATPADRAETKPYTLVVNLRSTRLIDYLLNEGLRDHLNLTGTQTFNPSDPAHSAEAAAFMRRNLDGGTLHAVPRRDFYILVGSRLILRIGPNTDKDDIKSWQTGFCLGEGELRSSEGGSTQVKLPLGRLAVRTTKDIYNDRTIALDSASWSDVLPRFERGADLAHDLSRFHQFLRATNQIELLLLDATIFPYELVEGPVISAGKEAIVVRETPRPEARKVLRFVQREPGLEAFLQREMEEGTADAGKVILSGIGGDALVLPANGRGNQWQVTTVDTESQRATLERVIFDDEQPPPKAGFLRSAGMPGQTNLIRRRKQAIDSLDSHSYLLRSLAAPGQVYIDTGASELPVSLDPKVVDSAKRAAIEDILRVRPIYALQGPPGTGKTTLVAWLLREILKDDPVAQVLVTAQAHGAVDVLRARVTDAFANAGIEQRPLAIRLGARRGVEGGVETTNDTVEEVALEVLAGSVEALEGTELSSVQALWLDDAKIMIEELRRHEALESRANDFVELVKRGANLTYCTTSAGELEALAVDQSFDWSIVEEAGKAHGFDLALPLQAGHRWLLIGDHLQLPPYRYEDYLDGLTSLDSVVDALQNLPESASGLLDFEWTASWRERTQEQRDEFREYASDWLKTFKRIFEHCSVAVGGGDAGEQLTNEESRGAAAGMLVGQHRMHPDIGRLISGAYYQDRLDNRTESDDGRPLSRVTHDFNEPAEIQGRAIVWLDVPWCRIDRRTNEEGPAQGKPRYRNLAEAVALKAFLRTLKSKSGDAGEIAFLSPYNQQVALMRRQLKPSDLPTGLTPKADLTGRPLTAGRMGGVYTVDSFQGNQADVIAVSLVRNNGTAPGNGMGFLDDSSRINVLLSRAERLLILIGSWEFFAHQVSTVKMDDLAHPSWHWRRIMADLEGWTDSGRAVRLGADLRGLT